MSEGDREIGSTRRREESSAWRKPCAKWKLMDSASCILSRAKIVDSVAFDYLTRERAMNRGPSKKGPTSAHSRACRDSQTHSNRSLWNFICIPIRNIAIFCTHTHTRALTLKMEINNVSKFIKIQLVLCYLELVISLIAARHCFSLLAIPAALQRHDSFISFSLGGSRSLCTSIPFRFDSLAMIESKVKTTILCDACQLHRAYCMAVGIVGFSFDLQKALAMAEAFVCSETIAGGDETIATPEKCSRLVFNASNMGLKP